MELEAIKHKVNDIIFEVLQDSISYDDIKPDKHLIDDYHAESIQALEIFLTIMSDFDVEMERRSIVQLKNIEEIYLYVQSLLREKGLALAAENTGRTNGVF